MADIIRCKHYSEYKRCSVCLLAEPCSAGTAVGKVDGVEGPETKMAKDFAFSFYNSTAWKNTREEYKKYRGGLCEVCWSKGIVKAGEIVHHKTELTPSNITDESIALGWDNLQLVCRECHAKYHDRRQRRYRVDELGRVIF